MRPNQLLLFLSSDPAPRLSWTGAMMPTDYCSNLERPSRRGGAKRYGQVVLTSILCCAGIAANARAITAASCSQSAVQSAVDSAVVGDIVQVPAGLCTWTSSVNITKGITLLGAGITQTVITAGSAANTLVTISLSADVPVRVSGFFFDNVTYVGSGKTSISVDWNMNSAFAISSLRIDNNKFNKGTKCVLTNGSAIHGVIDHNSFVDCDGAVEADGDPKTWNYPINAGTDSALFIEDNTFVVDNNTTGWGDQEQIMHGHGNRTVIRNNTFDLTAYTNGNGLPIEAHGNGGCYTGNDGNDLRGMPIIEVYNNVIKVDHTYRMIYIRGGSALVFNNAMTTVRGSTATVVFAEEEGVGASPNLSGCWKTVWPAEDQINNSFVWNNTLNASPVTAIDLNYSTDTTFIQNGRDYFLHAPAASGGKETYTGRAGGAMMFSASAANAYYPYTPYTYPHPLVGGAPSTTLYPPTNVNVP